MHKDLISFGDLEVGVLFRTVGDTLYIYKKTSTHGAIIVRALRGGSNRLVNTGYFFYLHEVVLGGRVLIKL